MHEESAGGKEGISFYQALQHRIDSSPVRKVLGVVAPRGAGGSYSQGDILRTLRLKFAVWKFADGELQTRPLWLDKQVPQEELREVMDATEGYDILEVQARVSLEETASFASGRLMEITEKVSGNTELDAAARKLQEPITFEDSQFGTFLLDRGSNSFDAKTLWGSDEISLTFYMDDVSDPETVLATARALWAKREEWDERIRDQAVKRLLELKNNTWLEKGESPLTPQTFKARMIPSSLMIQETGNFEFWFDDGDLFWGHLIMVEGTLQTGPVEAGIHG